MRAVPASWLTAATLGALGLLALKTLAPDAEPAGTYDQEFFGRWRPAFQLPVAALAATAATAATEPDLWSTHGILPCGIEILLGCLLGLFLVNAFRPARGRHR
ncbi:hypothetical protein [Actinomadura rugatobispora]|uniref:Uncharacterized protein n=1 Tax=Actinomadura rugatobispora TaxID=1994 RepID=A0ABW0ZV93_9ACTN|nr:hypothetical protein GCM10010200_096590 [Actinomadura rugatobispora]